LCREVGEGFGNESEADAAIDVVAHAARADHARLRIHGRHAADRKAIAPVDIGHGNAVAHDAGKVGDVAHLIERFLDVRVM